MDALGINALSMAVRIWSSRLVSSSGFYCPVCQKSPEELTAAIVRRLRDVRVEKGISQNHLSQLAGISRTGLRHIESGSVSPSLVNVVRLARALDLSLEELVDIRDA